MEQGERRMTKEEQQFNQWFDEYADGVKVFEEADMKQAYLQGRAELEKENGKLLQRIEQLEKDVIENESDCSMCNFPKLKTELEKENAKLKSIADFQQSGNMSRYFELKRQAEKLEEAKELLKQWLSLCGFKVEKLAKDTEQFINSEVEK